MKMEIQALPLAGASLILQSSFQDERGRFTRLFCQHALAPVLAGRDIKQMNFSVTQTVGTVRGLHYQLAPKAEMKLIRCVTGRVWDVMVDLRPESSTYLQWHAEELTQENGKMMVIPEGCAHGFQVLEAESELVYLHTESYAPDKDDGVSPVDAELAIAWPLPVQGLSARDQALPSLADWRRHHAV